MDYKFIINRLRRMSIYEILFRMKQKIRIEMESHFLCFYRIDTNSHNKNLTLFNLDIENIDSKLLKNKADALTEGRFNLFVLNNLKIGQDIDFHKDYKSGLSAPRYKFGKSINYRDSKKIGDIKYIWEINRNLFLLTLALAYKKFNNKKYLLKYELYLKSWLDQNEFMKGVNWCSSLELGIRLINWVFCWLLINNDLDEELKVRWLDSIYRHCWFIERNLSSYSSANNHLIGEISGLFAASTVFPGFNKSFKWQNLSYRKLVQECERQNYPDGVNKEQAVSYQQFVLDFLIIAGLIGRTNNKHFPPEYWYRIEKMLEYLYALEDSNGNIPQIGDEDDGFVVDLNQKEFGTYRSLLNTGAYIFNRNDFLKDRRHLDDKTFFFLSLGGYDTGSKLKKIENTVYKFPDGGYYILGTNFKKKREQKLIFDCGPHGYLSISAHGHADALSFTFFADGKPVFIDPGTYAYHVNEKWRNYFRSTKAHNTLTIDGQNQSEITGNFMWGYKATANLVEYKEHYSAKGTHDGYMRLKDKVKHTREITYNKKNNFWEITDEISCAGKHKAVLFFHCSPKCKVIGKNKHYKIIFPGGVCSFKIQSNMEVSLHKGEEDSCLGWYSPAYNLKIATTTIKLEKEILGNEKIVTGFEIKYN
jgi:hypothetical protein